MHGANVVEVVDDLMGCMFDACPHLDFVDLQCNSTSAEIKEFKRWVKKGKGERYQSSGVVRYEKFQECAYATII